MIRLARAEDAAGMLAIYTPIVESTAASFEHVVPSLEEFRARIVNGLNIAPWLVLEDDGEIIGYAYGALFRSRAAYQWTIETTIHVKSGYRGKGLGKKLYLTLLNLLRAQGFCNAVAVIEARNTGSVSFHEALGFEKVGIFRRAGFKLNEWQHSGWWQLILREDPVPLKIRPMDSFILSPEFRSICP